MSVEQNAYAGLSLARDLLHLALDRKAIAIGTPQLGSPTDSCKEHSTALRPDYSGLSITTGNDYIAGDYHVEWETSLLN
jgi:hypothetical protein